MSADQEKKYRRAAQVDTSSVGDRIVLYDRDARKALVLNATGAGIWRLLTESRATSELVRALARDFTSLAPDEALRDVTHFIEELLAQGVIVAEE